MKALVGGLILLAGLSACGSAAAARPGTVLADWGDDGGTMRLVPGQVIEVRLAGQSCTRTTVPVAAPAGVLTVDSVGTDHGSAWARMHARHRGSVTISATNGDACALSASGMAPQPFRLVVVVR